MKKLALTIAIVLGLGLATFANPNEGGLFKRGNEPTRAEGNEPLVPQLPNHGETGNQDSPIGTGIALLIGFGAAYVLDKKRKEK